MLETSSQMKEKIIGEYISSGMPGWEKLAATMLHPIKVRVGYWLGHVLTQDDSLATTENINVYMQEYKLHGPVDFQELERDMDNMTHDIWDYIQQKWTCALVAEPEKGDLDLVDQLIIEKGKDVRLFANARIYSTLLHRNPKNGLGLILDGVPVTYKTAMVRTMHCLNDFNGVVVTTAGKINLKVQPRVELQGDDYVRIVAHVNYGIELAPFCRAISLG